MQKATAHLAIDGVFFTVSVILAFIAARFGWAHMLVTKFPHWEILTTLIAGCFFTSIFTTAPALVVLTSLSEHQPLLITAFWGALGGVLGEYVIYYFIRDHVSADLRFLYQKLRKDKSPINFPSVFRKPIFRWIIPLVGAVIIASPLPDELGLTILGLSKVKTSTMLVLTYSLNFIGILLIGVIARGAIF